jgi:hypothetical protein
MQAVRVDFTIFEEGPSVTQLADEMELRCKRVN